MNYSRQLYIRSLNEEFVNTFGGEHYRALKRAWARGKEAGIEEYRKLCRIREQTKRLKTKQLEAIRAKAIAAKAKKAKEAKTKFSKNDVKDLRKIAEGKQLHKGGFFRRAVRRVKNFITRKR